jgi:hypothetical protein
MNFSSGKAVITGRNLRLLSLSLPAALSGLFLTAPAGAETMETGQLMAGTRYQTPYYIKRGDIPGPTAVIVGGVHGDEPAGYLATRQLRAWKVTRGTLVLVPDAHIEAIRRHVRAYPRNMNRLFPGRPDGDDMEKLAFEIWQLIQKSKPQLVLTLHESRGFFLEDPTRYGQTFTFDFNELKPFMGRVAAKVNAGIGPKKNQFRLKVDPFPTCPTYVTWQYLKVPATSIETAKPLALKTRIQYQLAAVQCFLDEIGLKYVPVKLSGTE